ncbi:MAG TPA: DUF424 family protein [archaeon]|nr:DUF424 family protein [archaeon]
MMFSYKLFETGDDKLLAVCDANILGKTFTEGDLTLHVSKDFYGEKKSDAAAVLKIAKKSTIINAVGNDIVQLLIDKKIVNEESVIQIGKVRHAQVVSIA